jgi:hypothetical protein
MGIYYAETHSKDRELFRQLGLREFAIGQGWSDSDPRLNDWRDLGTVEFEWAEVRVEVCCLPAQFFRFTITAKTEDVQGTVLTTGSGALSDFWPTIDLWASGMIGVAKEAAANAEP